MTSAKRRSEFGEASEMTSAKHRSEFGEASEMTSAKRGSTVFGETSERVRRSFGVPFSASVLCSLPILIAIFYIAYKLCHKLRSVLKIILKNCKKPAYTYPKDEELNTDLIDRSRPIVTSLE